VNPRILKILIQTVWFDETISKKGNINMTQQTVQPVKPAISPEQIILAIKNMEKELQEAFIEDLLAAVSPEYLESIREAREDYKEGRVYSHEDVFGE